MLRLQYSISNYFSRVFGRSLLTKAVTAQLLWVVLAAADVQTGVVRSGGRPIPGAAVTADCGSDRISTVTDTNGRFELGGLPDTPCHFSAAIFGFEQARQDIKASSSPVTFDLKLQTRASLPVTSSPVTSTTPTAAIAAPKPADAKPADTPPATASTPPPGGRGGGPGGGGRGGPGGQLAGGRGGRGGQNGPPNAPGPNRGGFQNLSLVQNGEAASTDSEVAPGSLGSVDVNSGANEALIISGSLSSAVQTQQGDGLGMGGPQGFGFGGPGGIAGPADFGQRLDGGPGGPGQDGAGGLPGAGGGGRGGAGGGAVFGGGRGGGGFGGGGGGGGRGGPGGGRGPQAANGRGQFGNRINRGRGQQWRLSANYSFGNSALNARPYSFTAPQLSNGQQVPKAAYANNRFGFSVGGPLAIPKLFRSDKTFWFVN
ncbi:MAG: hypothetical protein QOJ99_665 [Bryobacterales bacterium]|nr:hypothetical protein [Bryobacterales bacterium]